MSQADSLCLKPGLKLGQLCGQSHQWHLSDDDAAGVFEPHC